MTLGGVWAHQRNLKQFSQLEDGNVCGGAVTLDVITSEQVSCIWRTGISYVPNGRIIVAVHGFQSGCTENRDSGRLVRAGMTFKLNQVHGLHQSALKESRKCGSGGRSVCRAGRTGIFGSSRGAIISDEQVSKDGLATNADLYIRVTSRTLRMPIHFQQSVVRSCWYDQRTQCH
jgi:hypothetical protein